MPYYRLYHLNDHGSISSFDETECADDASAMAFVATKLAGRPMELWNQDRRVASFDQSGEPVVAIARAEARAKRA